jgi:hypothetical protein
MFSFFKKINRIGYDKKFRLGQACEKANIASNQSAHTMRQFQNSGSSSAAS